MDMSAYKLKDMIVTAYNDVTTIKCHEGKHDDYAVNSELVANTTAKLQVLLEDELGDLQLPTNIRSIIDDMETKMERLAWQNIINEQLVNSGALRCDEPIDRDLLKSLLLNKLL